MKDTSKSDLLKASFEFSGEEYELRRRVLSFVSATMIALGVDKIADPALRLRRVGPCANPLDARHRQADHRAPSRAQAVRALRRDRAGHARVQAHVILTGGQTGVDWAAMVAAEQLGRPFMVRTFRGFRPRGGRWFPPSWPVVQLPPPGNRSTYASLLAWRTIENVRVADDVLILLDEKHLLPNPRGSRLTHRVAEDFGKQPIVQYLGVQAPRFLEGMGAGDRVLMIAGPRDMDEAAATAWLVEALR
jgi:hypothetical protein